MQAKYPFASPYNFGLNTPIQAKDPDGRLVIFINGQHSGTWGKEYWNKGDMNAKIMERIGDNRAMYFDGAMGGWKNTATARTFESNRSAFERNMAGYKAGLASAQSIIRNLHKDKDGNITESVKIITHSMGGAYGKGFIRGLNEYVNTNNKNVYDQKTGAGVPNPEVNYTEIKGFKIEYEVDFAPFQPNNQSAVPGVKTIQISHKKDNVVNTPVIDFYGSEEEKMGGVKKEDYYLNNETKGHGITTFKDEVKNIPSSNSNLGR